jgi:multidrug efflux pump subunit AcrA (membrane-fusion protein)
MTERTSASWAVYLLGALCAGAVAAAILVVGPASGSQTTRSRTATVANGVVQSTVSGSGNLQASSQLNLGFKTSGTVTHIYVHQGEQVAEGQLLATLDPQSAEVTLEQAKAALQSSEAALAKEEETGGESSAGQNASGSGASASAASLAGPTGPTGTPTTPATTTPTGSSPANTGPTKSSQGKATPVTQKGESKKTGTSGSSKGGSSTSTSSSSTSPSSSVSPATREANLASARAAVKSDTLTVQGDEQAVQNTKLYAPEDGTIVSLSGQVGETVSGSGTTKASTSSASSSGGSGSTATGAAGASTGARSSAASTSSTSASSSSSSAFAVLSDLNSMQLVVPLSESEISDVKQGQIATVTVEALEGVKLAAHVSEVAILSTSNSGVVSYDVTFQLDQMESGLKPGMSATAEVVVKQAEGVNVPSTAISGGSVTVMEGGKQARRAVVSGLKGNSSTIILSGLKAGEKVVLPVATSTSTTSSGRLGGLGRTGGLGGAGGGLGGGAGGLGAGAFLRGGGG